jgi:redox-sensitive bicupin YhaK (pirin superfamily)
MKKIVFKSETRGKFQNEWLNTNYSFSFADYFDRSRINFGALRVLNDDIIQPGQGFGKHPHDNMEIITIPLSGSLSHQDSMGHKQEIKQNEVQVMSAGTGIFHTEYNASESDEVSLFQIWIYPASMNIKPAYSQKYFEPKEAENSWQELVSGDYSNKTSLHINQNAKISRLLLSNGKKIEYQLNKDSFGSFIFLIDGEIEISGEKLSKRDAIGIYETQKFEIHALKDSFILNIEVPEK